jgi:hypothetical protein
VSYPETPHYEHMRGYDHGLDDCPLTDCPHAPGDPLGIAWARGWTEGTRRRLHMTGDMRRNTEEARRTATRDILQETRVDPTLAILGPPERDLEENGPSWTGGVTISVDTTVYQEALRNVQTLIRTFHGTRDAAVHITTTWSAWDWSSLDQKAPRSLHEPPPFIFTSTA